MINKLPLFSTGTRLPIKGKSKFIGFHPRNGAVPDLNSLLTMVWRNLPQIGSSIALKIDRPAGFPEGNLTSGYVWSAHRDPHALGFFFKRFTGNGSHREVPADWGVQYMGTLTVDSISCALGTSGVTEVTIHVSEYLHLTYYGYD